VQVGAEFLARHYPVRTVLLPSPTWANHTKIFPLAGISDVRTYRYFRPATRDLDFQVHFLRPSSFSVASRAS
jgi:aspartate aminotransferase